ncbi:hypothetical protein AHAS_Ahas15G0195500 [Arachis hypogaea]
MTHWDGLMTKPGERILVLAATNRPFDLDEAIIRRFERRRQHCLLHYMPLLWCITLDHFVENRGKILKTLLAKEKVDQDLDLKELATMMEGYSGSDLKPSIDIKTVLSQLMERLSHYAASSAEVLPEFSQVEAFAKLSNAIGRLSGAPKLFSSDMVLIHVLFDGNDLSGSIPEILGLV